MSRLHGPALVLLSFLASAARAQSPGASAPRALGARTVVLTGAPVPVHVAPKTATLLIFDPDLDLEHTKLERDSLFIVHVWSAHAIALEPLAELTDPVTLTVSFQGAAPGKPQRVLLVTPPSGVDAQVRLVPSASATETHVAELEARNAACEARLAEAEEGAGVPSEVALVRAGKVGQRGVRVIKGEPDSSAGGKGAQEARWIVSHVADEWVVVTVPWDGARVQTGWQPGRAWLVGDTLGERFAAHTVLLEPADPRTNAAARLVVGAVRPPSSAGSVFRLEVHAAGGQAPLSIPGVTLGTLKEEGPE